MSIPSTLVEPQRPGALVGDIELTFHTIAGYQLWTGREDESDIKKRIMGIKAFARKVNIIEEAIKKDDPYADWYLLQLEEGILNARSKINSVHKEIKLFYEQLPSNVLSSRPQSSSPIIAKGIFSSRIAHLLAYATADFDSMALTTIDAHHKLLISTKKKVITIKEGMRLIRSSINIINGYKVTSVTRRDVIERNSVAIKAEEEMSVLPQDVLGGEYRSEFAPEIHHNSLESLLG